MASLLITGISGYVGQAVAPLAAAAFASVSGTYHRRAPAAAAGVSLVRAAIEDIPALIRSARPDVVLHTAAAWRTEAEARAVIVEGMRGVALACAETGARLVQLSTDLVFDGEHGPYAEDDPPAPVNFYGAAKAEAERIVAEVFSLTREGRPSTPFRSAQDAPPSNAFHSAQDAPPSNAFRSAQDAPPPNAFRSAQDAPPLNAFRSAQDAPPSNAFRSAQDAPPANAVIVRTSLVTCFDPPDPRTQPILAALRGERAPLTLFTDEYRCPVRVDDLAAALVELAGNNYAGILHVAGPERLSRYALGLRIAAHHRLDPAAGIRPGLSTDSGMIRPRDCSLRIDRARRVLRTMLRPLPNP